jgi:hypothetical protein
MQIKNLATQCWAAHGPRLLAFGLAQRHNTPDVVTAPTVLRGGATGAALPVA